MAYASRLSCHQSFTNDSRRNILPAKIERFQIFCNSSGAEDQFSEYVVESDSQIRTILEEYMPETNVSVNRDSELLWLPKTIKDFILPSGFPDSVSDDYLEYILLQFPTNVTGWICHTLVTSSLLKARSFSGTTAAASAAAISWMIVCAKVRSISCVCRWVSKGGIGSVGRLLIGGRFGNLFDDDPKQWRLYADFIGSTGSIFDLSTQLYPAYFLPLASLGNLAKAVGRGLRDPSFRVIQNHFAISGNLGEVSAKEEVWEVAAELVGLSLGILALDTPGITSSYPMFVSTWLVMRLLHLWFRYLSLSVLRFNTINLKRARILVDSHILYDKVPGISDCNRMENILVWEKFIRPRIIFDVSLDEMVTGKRRGSMEGATSLSVLRSVWQSYWLHQNWNNSVDMFEQLGQSLIELNNKFDDFMLQIEEAGWNTNQISLKVPKEILIQENQVV
ncbi:hypothetical protein RD792_011793 [Penstemon davidsonii]|uniref:Protein root UVB sensitive/RUS domain-containing protein n=1 Tax=Penstemon davidsonii TaxID=160366 RepID=A0ABR0CVL3_9LAMI|nr:hypothetical protein RD792_011793 [Penstemon davidsonii]